MTQVPASSHGGGSAASLVGCVLTCAATDVHAGAGSYPLLWDGLVDNPYDFNNLSAIPAGVGVTALHDGTSAVITTTAAGFWSFCFLVQGANADATWNGYLGDGSASMIRHTMIGNVNTAAYAMVTFVAQLPSGATFTPQVTTRVAATANPYNVYAQLSIVRLA